MKYDPMSRRFFLQGLGGSMLMLPVLPSLIPMAHAQTATPEKFLILIGSDHGGTGIDDWFPAPVVNNLNASSLTQYTLFPTGGPNNLDHIIRHGRLNQMLTANPGHAGGNVDNGQARLSYVLGSFFNPFLSKMNVFRGIDGGMFYSGHSNGIFSGNLKAAVNANVDELEPWPSLDRFLAGSSKFYPDKTKISTDVLNLGSMSYLANGDLVPRTQGRISDYYNILFNKYEQNSTPAEIAQREKKEFLLDRVLGDYNRFLRGAHGPARTLSSVDKQRVEEHAEKLHELQKRSQNVINTCGDVTGPNGPNSFSHSQVGFEQVAISYNLLADLITSAFKCGSTKALSLTLGSTGETYSGNYHQDIAHRCTEPAIQLVHNTMFRWQAENVVSKLVEKLDADSIDGQSGSILDNALVQWTHECGTETHQQDSIGCINFGSLGGHFNTGNYVDYRNMKNMGLITGSLNGRRPGLPIQQLWANIIQGFNFNRSDFERHGRSGYGDTSRNDFPRGNANLNRGHQPYPSRVRGSLSGPLPIIKA